MVTPAKAVAQQRAKLLGLQAARHELKLRQEMGDTLPTKDVEREWCRMAGNMRARLLAIPHSVAPRVVACSNVAQVAQLLQQEIHAALAELADPNYNPPTARPELKAAPPVPKGRGKGTRHAKG
jgi:phage terminase Nu1 subunit (DNA packaging protein)